MWVRRKMEKVIGKGKKKKSEEILEVICKIKNK